MSEARGKPALDAKGVKYEIRSGGTEVAVEKGMETDARMALADVPGIGPLTATRLGIRPVDVGIPILSMHSARELCGVEDPYRLAMVTELFFRTAA